jgi:hypothetical protein
MFRSCSEGLVIVGWIRLVFMKQDLFCCQIYIYIYIYILPVPKIRSGIEAIGSS